MGNPSPLWNFTIHHVDKNFIVLWKTFQKVLYNILLECKKSFKWICYNISSSIIYRERPDLNILIEHMVFHPFSEIKRKWMFLIGILFHLPRQASIPTGIGLGH